MNQFGMIPVELRALKQWVVWKEIVKEEGKEPTKPPFNPHNGSFARTHNQQGKTYTDTPQDTWGTYAEALHTYNRGNWSGIGFVFTENDGYLGIDLDDCIIKGRALPEAKRLVDLFDSYTEYSPSKSGVHILVKSSLPETGIHLSHIELYDRSRYFTMTGNQVKNTRCSIEERQEQIDQILSEVTEPKKEPVFIPTRPALALSDSELLDKARKDTKFCDLYDRGILTQYDNDDSRGDCALCAKIAFWTGPDPSTIDRWFRGSVLYRKKWDRADYSRRTIEAALSVQSEFYSPNGNNTYSHKIKTVDPVTGVITEEDPFRPSESGSADRIIAAHGDDIRHAYKENIWYSWIGNRWAARSEGRVLALVEDELRSVYDEAITDTQGDRKALAKYALRTESSRYMNSVAQIMRHRKKISAIPLDFDADPYLLYCPNGALTPTNGQIREHRKTDMVTKMAGAPYDPNATSPLWEKFIRRILPNEEDRDFIQRACGYSLTGDTTAQCLFFLFGDGSNGKSVFCATMLSVLGEYGMQAASDLLLAKRGDHIPVEIAELEGKRFVATIEIDQGRKMAEGLVKQMTGGDRIKAHFKYQNPFEFQPTHKIFLAANHHPNISGMDHAIWRRIHLIPFSETIGIKEQDPELSAKLREELSGILTWCVRGCIDWARDKKLHPPNSVIEATERYREDQDIIGQFISECCVMETGRNVEGNRIYEAYKAWCVRNGHAPQTNTAFGMELTKRNHPSIPGRRVKYRAGIDLIGEALEM